MLGEMTAFLTHEVRNSLGAIYGYTKSIGTEIRKFGKEGLGRKVSKVNHEIEFLSRMMESFLSFSRPVRVEKKEKINLKDMIRKIGRENKVKVKLQQRDIFFHSDPVLINSIFSNLIINAREAKAGQIHIVFKDDPHLEIFFMDNGKGMEPNISEKIWYPLFTTKENGTGMGLALVRKIIHSLRGDIQLVKSTPKGTTFKITFFK